MATDIEIQRKDCCVFYPDYAAVCMFIEKFGDLLGLLKLNIKNLQEGFEDLSEGLWYLLLQFSTPLVITQNQI